MSSSLRETWDIPAWARDKGLTRCFVYNGTSMLPTFRPGHLLYVRPSARDVVSGDIIVFTDPVAGHIVHRIAALHAAGLITRGDNNPYFDPLPVPLAQVVGRVEMRENQGHLKPIRGGQRGLWAARLGWGLRRVEKQLRALFRKPYHALRRSPWLRRLLHRCFARYLKTVRLETPDGTLIKTTFRGRTVARWWPERNVFMCRKPFDLFIPPPD